MTEQRRAGLDVIVGILEALDREGGAARKYVLLSGLGLAYNNPRWLQAMAKALVTVGKTANPASARWPESDAVTITDKGRRALAAWRALEAELG